MVDMNEVVAFFRRNGSIKRTAREYGLSECTVRKALITAGAYESTWSARIAELREQGLCDAQIAERLHISRTAVNAHSPYTKGYYNSMTPTINAARIRTHRNKRSESARAMERPWNGKEGKK